MTSRDFCYWLQGFFELEGGEPLLNAEQVKCIRQHLALVFKHEIDPSAGDEKHQAELNAIHSPPVTAETIKQAVEDAVAKLPKPMRPEPPGGIKYRC